MTEIKWSCGCHVVDGELVAQCTQAQSQGEISAEKHAAARPYSAKCYREAPTSASVVEPASPAPEPESASAKFSKSDRLRRTPQTDEDPTAA
jgi:hypothetical protein